MEGIASASALVLCVVFAVAGVAKLARPGDTRASFGGLGVPAPRASAVVVPVVELALAVALVARPAVAGWGAVALLAAFSVAIAVAVGRGVEAPCSCFGTARHEPVSSAELVRNALLGALAIVATGADGRAGWPGLPEVVLVTVAVALGRVGLAVIDFRRRGNRLFPDLPGRA